MLKFLTKKTTKKNNKKTDTKYNLYSKLEYYFLKK